MKASLRKTRERFSLKDEGEYAGGVFKFRTIEEAQKAREKHLPLK